MHVLVMLAALLSLALESKVAAIIPQPKELRILPLGASVTWGWGSSTGNGYRETLRNLLHPASVTYIGTQCSGSMTNSNNEGHPGYIIASMQSLSTADLPYKPNVVLIYVGTNDMKAINGGNYTTAPDNMATLVKYLVANLPNSLIVVSKLFLNADPVVQQRIDTFNSKLSSLQNLGNVVIADLSSTLRPSDLNSDGTHPNDGGYVKMATVFYNVLIQAGNQGRISGPESRPELSNLKICNPPEPASNLTTSTIKITTAIPSTSAVSSSVTTTHSMIPRTTTISPVSSTPSRTRPTPPIISTTTTTAQSLTKSLVHPVPQTLDKSSTLTSRQTVTSSSYTLYSSSVRTESATTSTSATISTRTNFSTSRASTTASSNTSTTTPRSGSSMPSSTAISQTNRTTTSDAQRTSDISMRDLNGSSSAVQVNPGSEGSPRKVSAALVLNVWIGNVVVGLIFGTSCSLLL